MVEPGTAPAARVVSHIGPAVVVQLQWRPAGAAGVRELFQVVRVRSGKIQEMADHQALGPATRTAKRFAARDA